MDILIVFAIIAFFLFLQGIYISHKGKTTDKIQDTNFHNKNISVSNTTCQPEQNYIKEENKFSIVKVKYIIDGDTVIVIKNRKEYKVRLASIDCPEDGQHWGDTATYGLVKLIGGKLVHLEEHGVDCYGRIIATIYVKKETELININERMVALGHAWVMRKYYHHLPQHKKDALNRLERWARSKKVGLWKTPNPIPPWKWRDKTVNKQQLRQQTSYKA